MSYWFSGWKGYWGYRSVFRHKDRDPDIEQNDSLGTRQVARADSLSGEGGSEVVSVSDGRLFVTNGFEGRIDIFDQATGKPAGGISLTSIPGFNGIQSVSARSGLVAVAVDIADGTAGPSNGVVAIFDSHSLSPLRQVEVGNLPDQLTFSEDGKSIFVANEGEPDGPDAPGSISIIDVASGTVETFGFEGFDDQVDALRADGVRIFPGKLPSVDFEPEFVAEDAANGKLYVSLQEANAIAEFDLESRSFTRIIGLGTKDHSAVGNGLDFNDADGEINIQTVPVKGLYMPDAIATASINGQTYLLTANEGDDRTDFLEVSDAARVGDVLAGKIPGARFDAALVAEIKALQAQGKDLSRLNISIIDGDTDGDGDIDELNAYGARSFTIFDLQGNVVFDSGDQFEQFIAANRVPNAFNNDNFPSGDPDFVDETRSDNKGPEPEAITTGKIGDKTLAFIGLERDSGIMIYDISDPANSKFLQYIDSAADGNISPEIIQFIPAEDSPTGNPSIAVSFEVSGTTAIYELEFGQTIRDAPGQASRLEGGLGDDVIHGRDRADKLFGMDGDDELRGGSGRDALYGGDGDDRLFGGSGRDLLEGGDGDDVLYGGSGRDALYGGVGADRLFGGAGRDLLEGGDGEDALHGGAGRDVLYGGAGDDVLSGGDGADRLTLGGGDDTATGGRGRDVFIFEAGIGTATVTDFTYFDRIALDGVSLVSVDQMGDDTRLTLSDGGTVILEDTDRGYPLSHWIEETLTS